MFEFVCKVRHRCGIPSEASVGVKRGIELRMSAASAGVSMEEQEPCRGVKPAGQLRVKSGCYPGDAADCLDSRVARCIARA